VRSPVAIDKKYASEDFNEDYHILKNTESNDYYAVTYMSVSDKSKAEAKKNDDKVND
jgi:hypothetical protein